MNFTQCVNRSLEFVRSLLFGPFSFSLWLVLALPAWLASSLGGGGGTNFLPKDTGDVLTKWLEREPRTAVSVIGGAILLLIVLSLVLYWVRCRAQFCFLQALESGRTGTSFCENWKTFRKQGNGFFLVSMAFGIIVSLVFLITVAAFAAAVFFVWPVSHASAFCLIAAEALIFIVCLFALCVFSAAFAGLAPVWMYDSRELTAGAALERTWKIFRSCPGVLIKYALSVLLVNICIGTIVTMACLLTCCLAAIVLLIPYIGTVAILPLVCFKQRFIMECAREIRTETQSPEA